MEEDDSINFAEVLSSKLCHDLISPVGALGNGLEFLVEEGAYDSNTEISDVLQHSAKQAIERLAYFRVSIGAAGAHTRLEYGYLYELVNKLAIEKRIDLNWQGFDDYKNSDSDKAHVKLLLNIAMLSFDCLPSGGIAEIKVFKNKDKPNLLIKVEGNPTILHKEINEVFSVLKYKGPNTARNILAIYTQKVANLSGKTTSVRIVKKNHVEFKLTD